MSIWTFLFLLIATPTFAQKIKKADCAPIDASTHMGPVRDQGSTNWCFAFVSADLMTEHLKLDPKKRVSAFDMALNFYKQDPKDVMKAFDEVWSKKFASEPPEIQEAARNFFKTMGEFTLGNRPTNVLQLEGGWASLTMLLYNKAGVCSEDKLPSEMSPTFAEQRDYILKSLERAQENIFNKDTSFLKRCFPLSAPPDGPQLLTSFAKILDTENKKTILHNLQNICKSRTPINPVLPVSSFESPEINMARVNANLSKKIPTGITYDVGKLFEKDARVSPSQTSHESSIVARRWNAKTEQCEFKLRNSWGTSWCPSNVFPADRCDKGNVWLTSGELAPFIVTTTSILPD